MTDRARHWRTLVREQERSALNQGKRPAKHMDWEGRGVVAVASPWSPGLMTTGISPHVHACHRSTRGISCAAEPFQEVP